MKKKIPSILFVASVWGFMTFLTFFNQYAPDEVTTIAITGVLFTPMLIAWFLWRNPEFRDLENTEYKSDQMKVISFWEILALFIASGISWLVVWPLLGHFEGLGIMIVLVVQTVLAYYLMRRHNVPFAEYRSNQPFARSGIEQWPFAGAYILTVIMTTFLGLFVAVYFNN